MKEKQRQMRVSVRCEDLVMKILHRNPPCGMEFAEILDAVRAHRFPNEIQREKAWLFLERSLRNELAAPDLLAALDQALDRIEDLSSLAGVPYEGDTVETARAAIAKARGEGAV
jgi:hypothetical protein